MMMRTIINWVDKREAKAKETGDKEDERKLMRASFVEGMVDGAILMYPFLVIACNYWKKKAIK